MKHRLAGAVILVGAAVMVIPWMLSTPDGALLGNRVTEAREVTVDESFIEPVELVITRETVDEPEPVVNLKPAAESSAPPVKTETATPEKPAAKTKTAAKSPTQPPKKSGWEVRVGTFGKPANVKSVKAKLAKNGLTARTTVIPTDSGKFTRIWLGPYSKQAKAAEINQLVTKLFGEKGLIIKHNPQ